MGMNIEKLIGATVTDFRGTISGIVISLTEGKENEVMIRAWHPKMKKYLFYSKHFALLKVVEDLNEIERGDLLVYIRYRIVAKECAVNSNDKQWFEECDDVRLLE